jgi:hypothetical protein
MCLRRAPEKYIAGAALDRAGLGSHVCLENRRTDGGEVVSRTHRPLFGSQGDSCYFISGSRWVPQGDSAAKECSYLVGNRIRDVLASSIMPQLTRLRPV